MNAFTYERDADGIVTIVMDMDGPVNVMNRDFAKLFADAIDMLEDETDMTGVVLTSAKGTFFVGGDLKWLVSLRPGAERELFDFVESVKADMRRLELIGVPVVAAINGSALGGGFEIALACHRRIAVGDNRIKLGLPEVTIGLLPGAGGVVRMTYLLGMEGALPSLLEGRLMSPDKASKSGLLDEIVEKSEQLIPAAKTMIHDITANSEPFAQPWDDQGYLIPGGKSTDPRLAPKIAGASAAVYKKTRSLIPGPAHILDIMAQAAGNVSFQSALRCESRAFAKIATSQAARNMISCFFLGMNRIKSGFARPDSVPRSEVSSILVLGAGMMGQGIAYVAASAGISVVLKDVSLAAAEKGKAYSAQILDRKVQRGSLASADRDRILDRISPTSTIGSLEKFDMIIEAVFERLDVKKDALENHEELLADGGIWASNTSSLPISTLAESSSRPENFIGLHFFSPVDKMPLLEIVRGQQTSDQTLARSFDFALKIRKVPIVVNDKVGFFTSRTISAKMDEAAQMVAEGLDPVRVENLGHATGFPTGLLSLFDEVRLSLVMQVNDTQISMGLRDPSADATPEARALLREMVEVHQRKGRADGGGFFDYDGGEKRIWQGLTKWRVAGREIPDEDICDRLLYRAVLETWKCLEENVLKSTEEANIGSVLGIGAPTWTGGYAQFVEGLGAARFVDRCRALSAKYGDRFNPPEILVRKAQSA